MIHFSGFVVVVGNGGKWLEKSILVVAMHLTDSGRRNKVFNFIGTNNHPLHSLKLTNIFYRKNHIFDDNAKTQARKDIKRFLQEKK